MKRLIPTALALAHLFPVVLVAAVVLLSGCKAFDGKTRVGTPIGVTYEHTGPPAPPVAQTVNDSIFASIQQHRPTVGAGRISNAEFCDEIESDGYGEKHATWQKFCQMPPEAPRTPPAAICPDQHPDLAACQTQLMDAVERGDKATAEVKRLNSLIDNDYANDLNGKANEIKRLQNKMALLINPTDCRPNNEAGTELVCPNPEGSN